MMSIARSLLCLGALGLSLSPAIAFAERAGEVVYLSGTLTAQAPEAEPRLLAQSSSFNNSDVLQTHEQSFARVEFIDETQLALRPNTTLEVAQVSFDPVAPEADGVAVRLLKGGLRAVSGAIGERNQERVRYETPAGGIGIRGTHFGALYCQSDCAELRTIGGGPLRDGLHVDVADGRILISNRAGSLEVEAGQLAYVRDADTPPELVDEAEGYRVVMPASVLFDDFGALWSEETNCDDCTVR